jgi:TP901 family phage tail tape measure protein
MNGAVFEIRVVTGNSVQEITGVTASMQSAAGVTTSWTDKIKNIGNAAFAFNNIKTAIGTVAEELKSAVQPGIDFNSSLTDLQAITGVNNETLQQIGDNARKTGLIFGNDAAKGVESYKLFLSQLGPELANTPDALNEMGTQAAILSKQLKGDTAAATEILTTAFNQYGLSLADPARATRAMAEMMNIMTAAAKEGSAELPQIKAALEQAGMMAKTANIPFNELNAAIQILDKSGKKGAEGGVALRNTLATLSEGQFMNKQSLELLKAAGIDVSLLSNKSLSLSERLSALRSISGDTAAMTQLFGKENVSAAIALVTNANELQTLTQKITGTNAATEMADTIMGGFSERVSQITARLKDFGISIFNSVEGLIPFVTFGSSALQTISNLGGAVQAFSIIGNTQFVTTIGTAVTSFGTWIATTVSATAAQIGFNVAVSANPIGLLILAVAGVVAGIAALITYWDDITEAIADFGRWIADHNPFSWLIDFIDEYIPGFRQAFDDAIEGIKAAFEWLFGWIGDAWDAISDFFSSDEDEGAAAAISDAAVKGISDKLGKTEIEGITIAGAADNSSPLANYNPQKKGKGKNSATINETTSNITSGGNRPVNISLHINKLQDQIIINAENIEKGGHLAAERVVEILLEQLNGMNAALQGV